MDAPRPANLASQSSAHRLREAGLRATQPRLNVLHVLTDMGRHRSVDDIVADLQEQGTPLPRTSVYGVVAALLARGLLMVTDVGPGRALYELADGWHHHFVCRTCGSIQDVPCIVEERPCLSPEQIDGNVDEAQVIFRGRCSACLAAKNTRSKSLGRQPRRRH
ncbi:MAG: transcriptional repressor [Chloroflexi bacterium]|nr:transcriptional repressor [Chloroflexota bacterium]